MNQLTISLVAAFACFGSVAQSADKYTPGVPVSGNYDNFADGFLESHCYECHDYDTTKGDLNLLELGPVDETNAAVWKTVWAQVSLNEMPPKKKSQPEVIERLQFSDWVVKELQHVMKDKGGFKAHLDPLKGNFVDHDLLFGALPEGLELMPTSSPARLWRVTPQEHITRLNELINTEPTFDPEKPGLRTRGDVVPTNSRGESKLYFGIDRIIGSLRGGVSGFAVKSEPVVLSSAKAHGLENYPDLYFVNSAEATQILSKAESILRYMARGPLSIANPEQITDDPETYEKVRPKGDLRGKSTSLIYSTKIVRPLTPVYDLMKEDAQITDELLRAAVDYLFEALTFRPPAAEESDEYLEMVKDTIANVGKEDGVYMGLSSIFLDRDALFRSEMANTGKADEHGRAMLQDWELGLAVNHALGYLKPDEQLRQAITSGRMRSRQDVEREVARMLADDTIRKPRILRFFREYFDHDLAGYVCKDTQTLADNGITNKMGGSYYRVMFGATASTDRLIELILKQDTDVLKELLTTKQVVAADSDAIYFGRRHTQEEQKAAVIADKKADRERENKAKAEVKILAAQISELETRLQDESLSKKAKEALATKKKTLVRNEKLISSGAKQAGRENSSVYVDKVELSGPEIFARFSSFSAGSISLKPERKLATVSEGQRMGILTHPAWLVSHSDAMDNHAVHRGIWIRTRLLGGGIPDVPITVDAMLPDEPESTLRHRMRVTQEKYCWTCHEKMDPLGLPFEMYNNFGMFRTTELGGPVDTSGEIIDSGDPDLDGPVTNAIDMIQKLAESERVEQVFVRHAFRFWMGRNETLNDAPALQAAHKAYRDNGGSMNALITSLVTSDAFLYRKVEEYVETPGTGKLSDGVWINTAGKEIRAALLRVEGDSAVFKLTNGEIYKYSIASLSAESQAKVKEFAKK